MKNTNLHHHCTSPIINVMYRAISTVTTNMLRDFGEIESLQMSTKGPGNFICETNLKIEASIRDALKQLRPSYGFIGEASGEVPGDDPQYTWVLDPINGTSNFVHGFPHFCISLGLAKDQNPIAGMIYDPLRDELFFCSRGEGAYSRRHRLRVSKRNDLSTALAATCPLQSTDPKKFKRHNAATARIPAIRQTGSTALDLAYVAAGRLDLFWSEQLSPWDFMAGTLMVQEAGGYATDFQRRAVTLKAETIIAGTPTLQEHMLDLFDAA